MIIKFKPVPVEEKAEQHRIIRKPRDGCAHYLSFLVDGDAGKVFCSACKAEIDPMTALVRIAQASWRAEWSREQQVELEEKRVKRVQKAAIQHLFDAGITPEKYAERWAQLRAESQEKKAEVETKIVSINSDDAA